MAKVLVVDNDATTVSLLKILLGLDGHTVLDCGLAVHVLETVVREKPDFILMDIFLTGGDGLVLLRQIRANPATAGVPVVMTSGMELSAECAKAGANGFLPKPYTPEQLTTTMNQCLDHKRDPDASAAAP